MLWTRVVMIILMAGPRHGSVVLHPGKNYAIVASSLFSLFKIF